MTRKVSWGVLGAAEIGIEKVIPAMQRGEASRVDAIASRDIVKARRAAADLGVAKAYGSYEELLADPADRSDLQSPAQRAARPLDDPRARGGQARAVRKADRARRDGSGRADRGAPALRQARRRSLHGALSPAMAARARDRAIGRDRRRARDPDVLFLSADRRRQHPQPAAGRRRALRHRLLRDPHRAPCLRRRADARRRRARLSIPPSAPTD